MKPVATNSPQLLDKLRLRLRTSHYSYPYDWPGPGINRLRKRVTPEFIEFLKRATDPRPRGRFRDAIHMYNVFRRVRLGVLRKEQTKLTAPRNVLRFKAT